MNYQTFTSRNTGYVESTLQERIRNTTVLIAGCGIGSSMAEPLVRLGFQNFILADGDTVGVSNLNRQNYVAEDVGENKAVALANRLKAIRPDINVEVLEHFLTPDDVHQVVARADVVFDTIDYLDLPCIVAMHEAAREQGKYVLSALTVGWGAGCLSIPPDCPVPVREMFGIEADEPLHQLSYIEKFASIVERLKDYFDPQVMEVVGRALHVMENGIPCPASQVAPGALAVGALGATALVRILAGEAVRSAPEMVVLDLPSILQRPGVPINA